MLLSLSPLLFIMVGLQALLFSGSESTPPPSSPTAVDSFIQNHHFIFVSGWPQSGTSFVQQIFNFHPLASTMMEQCDRIKGKSCVNWNYEGQWLLSTLNRNVMNSGSMCEHPGNVSTEDRLRIVSEWQMFWSAERLFLVEKSPHFSLKIPCLREIFKGAKSTRFVVLIKHPVTLNTATPRSHGWKFVSTKSSNGEKIPVDQQTQLISEQQRSDAVTTFLDLMLQDSSSIYAYTHPKCAMGWLPTMVSLHQQLYKDPISRRDVRIVRYEEFVNPQPVCNRLFQFAFSGYHQGNDSGSLQVGNALSRGKTHQMLSSRLCHNHFSPKVLSQAASKQQKNADQLRIDHMNTRGRVTNSKKEDSVSRTTIKRVPSTKRNPDNAINRSSSTYLHHSHGNRSRRQLRLRSMYDNLVFMPELVSDNGLRRIRDFDFSFQRLNATLKSSLLKVEKELVGFGYSLFTWYTDGSSTRHHSSDRDGSNKLHPWEL